MKRYIDRRSLLIVVPTFNDADNLVDFYEDWVGVLDQIAHSKILFVLRNSGDNSGKILNKLKRKDLRIIISKYELPGHGKSVLHGYRYAVTNNYKWVFQVDSDNQFHAEDFFKLWKMRKSGHFILGKRESRKDTLIRLILSRILALMISKLYNIMIADYNCPFRLIKTNKLSGFLSFLERDVDYPNLIMSAYFLKQERIRNEQITKVKVSHLPRIKGKGTISLKYILKNSTKAIKEICYFR